MTSVRTRLQAGFRRLALLGVAAALLVPASAAALDDAPTPKGFPRASFVSGEPLSGETSRKGVLLHAQWFDDEGEPQKYFRMSRRFPWPKPAAVSDPSFRLRLKGVRYPGKLEVGVFKRTGTFAYPVGAHALYQCTFPSSPDAPCRWVPTATGGGEEWDVQIDHDQSKGHMYIVAVGTWDDPRDPPKPIGNRSQIATWLFHARLGRP